MKRALISVYDKRGIVDFASELRSLGWEIVSTGGTASLLKDSGIYVLEVEDITNFPEILEGRVKTLNPYIHGGILYKRDNKSHIETIKKNNIDPIDMVVNNLYPFEEIIKKENIGQEEILGNIDIGGPAMLRAAAKNYENVITLVDPSDYSHIIKKLNHNNNLDLNTKKHLAMKVFNHTAYYDSLIANYFNRDQSSNFSEKLLIGYEKIDELRYGENHKQKTAFYKETGQTNGTLIDGKQIHGKELSFNNINDGNGALRILKEFNEPTIVAVKHSNPCGIASGDSIEDAYKKAYECDTSSIFGGIIASNRKISREVAEKINEIFIELVMAPSFSKEALDILTEKKNIRIIEIKDIENNIYDERDIKKVFGGILIQERDDKLLLEDLDIPTDRKPTEGEMEDLLFAWKSAKNISSNGVIIAKDKATIGIGLGEVNRYWAVENAIYRSGDKIKESVLASDGFFPF